MYHQLELARTGEALSKIRGGHLKYNVIISVVIACFYAMLGLFTSDNANIAWFIIYFGIAAAGAELRYFATTCDGIQ